MVRASGQETATAAGAIAGGFVLVPVSSLMLAWRTVDVGDFRVWLACWEARARRQGIEAGRLAYHSVAEVAKLAGISGRRARASVKRLVAVGLIEWSTERIGFLEPGLIPAQTDPVSDSIGKGRGSLTIPRRMLRFLAAGSSRSVIATALGSLLRCLARRRSGWSSAGLVKASWIAGTFDLDERNIKAARRRLVSLGWLAVEETPQRVMNRYGPRCVIRLDWSRGACRQSPPLDPEIGRVIATPSVNQEPLPEREENQEPASGRSDQSGDWMQVQGKTSQSQDLPTTLPAPTLADIKPEDLTDTARTLVLHVQAVAKGLVTTSENDRLQFVALAEHARQVGKANPPGLFSALLRRGAWSFITQGEEDAAGRKLRVHLHGKPAPVVAPRRKSTFVPAIQNEEDRRAEMLRMLATRFP